jgi:hypothetical protein
MTASFEFSKESKWVTGARSDNNQRCAADCTCSTAAATSGGTLFLRISPLSKVCANQLLPSAALLWCVPNVPASTTFRAFLRQFLDRLLSMTAAYCLSAGFASPNHVVPEQAVGLN